MSAPVVQAWLSVAQRELVDRYAPQRIRLSNGKTPRVTYSEAGPPHISLRIQELFDVEQGPVIAMGRMPLSNPHPGAQHEAGSGHQRPGQLLAGALSRDQVRTAAKVSEARMAMTDRPAKGKKTNVLIPELVADLQQNT